MTSRERVEAALAFEPVDKAPLEYHPCGRGLYEHGEAFRRLLKAHPGDFEDFSDMPIRGRRQRPAARTEAIMSTKQTPGALRGNRAFLP